ncbi:MAG TPA: DoxX family protein [Chryseosolibacter sp.]
MKRSFETTFSQNKLDLWLLSLRVLVTAFMLTHGLPKFYRLMTGDLEFSDPIGIGEPATLILAVFAEVVCSTFIFIGLGTRIAAVPLITTMLVAAFISNWNDPFGKKELPLLYLFIYVTLMILGSGRYSLDFVLSKRLTQLKTRDGVR